MNYLLNKIISSFCLSLAFLSMDAQVQYQIDWLADAEVYQVSVVSETTYSTPKNLVSTAQVTLKVPSGQFELINLTLSDPAIEFELNSQTNSPAEAADWDYLSFGLTSFGTAFPFV